MFEAYSLELSRLYVRDPFDAWFSKGVDNNLDTSDRLFDYLANVIEQCNPSMVMCFGSSMGGYGALRLALRTPVDLCVATSPQTLLDTRLPHTPRGGTALPGYRFAASAGSRNELQHASIFRGGDFVDIYNLTRIHWNNA